MPDPASRNAALIIRSSRAVFVSLSFLLAPSLQAAALETCNEIASALFEHARFIESQRSDLKKLCNHDPDCYRSRASELDTWLDQQDGKVWSDLEDLWNSCAQDRGAFEPKAAYLDRRQALRDAITSPSFLGSKATGVSRPIQSDPPSIRSPAANQTVQVLFGTTRGTRPEAPPPKRFTAMRGQELLYGVATINIPANHVLGMVERPAWYKLLSVADPRSHVALLEAMPITSTEFARVLSTFSPSRSPSSVFVFIHGFRVSFEDAALRTAQMAIDMNVPSVPVFFSWPSQNAFFDYPTDNTNSVWTQKLLADFLLELSGKTNNIYLIAHSMGAQALTGALLEVFRVRPAVRNKFREVILAAPDIDADTFRGSTLPRLSNAVHLTLYAFSNDLALVTSKRYNGYARVGDSGSGLFVEDKLETVDATNVDTDFLGHSYYAESRAILTDLALLLRHSIRAADRPTLKLRASSGKPYWEFPK